MRVSLDETIVSFRASLTQMVKTLDSLLSAAYAPNQTDRAEIVAQRQQEIDQQASAMEALVIDVLATQQPILATDLIVVKGLLVASRQLGYIAHEQADLTHLMSQLGIVDTQLPTEVTALLPELRQVTAESVAAFLHDDRVLAEFTIDRINRLQLALEAVPMPIHSTTVVPVSQLHLHALRAILAAAREIVHCAPLYRYVSVPA